MSDAGDAAKAPMPAGGHAAGSHSGLAIVLPHVLRSFRREPALALTVAYLLVALAGIYYDYAYYQKGFGIPILSLAQIGDYLVAGLQRPWAIALMLLTLPLCWLMDRFNARSRRRQAVQRDALLETRSRTRWQAWRLRWLEWHLRQMWGLYFGYVIFVFVYGWVFVGIYARVQVGAIKRGDGAQVSVRLNGDAADLAASAGGKWAYLGGIANYIFVYDAAARQAMILPVNAVASLQPHPVATHPSPKRVVVPTP